MLIDVADIKGEQHTGYENRTVGGKDMGPFRCDNCHYYRPSNSSCGYEDMIKFSKQPMTSDGRRKVDAGGCCEFVARIGNIFNRA